MAPGARGRVLGLILNLTEAVYILYKCWCAGLTRRNRHSIWKARMGLTCGVLWKPDETDCDCSLCHPVLCVRAGGAFQLSQEPEEPGGAVRGPGVWQLWHLGPVHHSLPGQHPGGNRPDVAQAGRPGLGHHVQLNAAVCPAGHRPGPPAAAAQKPVSDLCPGSRQPDAFFVVHPRRRRPVQAGGAGGDVAERVHGHS